MGRNVYQKCVNILELRKGEKLTLDELKALIMMYIGSDARTVNQALETMAMTKLIKDIGNYRFKVL